MLRYLKNIISVLILSAILVECKNLYSFELDSMQTQLELYHTAEKDRLRSALEEGIKKAQKSILILTFSFSDSNFIDLINQKADEGIDVTVIIDKNHQNTLKNLGNNKIKILTRLMGEGRIHHKILVIDDEFIWLGSANFSQAAFSTQENFVVGIQSTKFANILHDEAKVFKGIRQRNSTSTPIETINDQSIFLYMLPHFNPLIISHEKKINGRGKKELLSIIENAQSHIQIAMMVWTDPELQNAVINAHNRGITVKVLLHDLQDPVAKNLIDAGIVVMTNPKLNFMHNKWMWVDDQILVNGSANWSRSSFSRNDESFLVIKNLNPTQHIYLTEYWNYLITKQ